METFLHSDHKMNTMTYLGDPSYPAYQIGQSLALFICIQGKPGGLHLTHKFIRLMHLTLSQFLGYFNRKLVSLLRAQGSVDDSGLQDSRAKWRWFIWCLIVFVSELLVDSWVLDHIG